MMAMNPTAELLHVVDSVGHCLLGRGQPATGCFRPDNVDIMTPGRGMTSLKGLYSLVRLETTASGVGPPPRDLCLHSFVVTCYGP